MITKIQKLSAIHNEKTPRETLSKVVYDYKDTKIVSNSQRIHRCRPLWIVVYDYKDTKFE